MPSTSACSTLSPISKLPYDILREIFIHCLRPQPQYFLELHQHSHPKNAPILLCHICSSWRTVALTAPTLWTRLSYSFTIVKGDDYDVSSASGSFRFLAREIEFVRWWRANQGHVAPSLNFCVYECDASRLKSRKTDDATSDVMDFLLEAIFAAQFFNLHQLFWSRIADMIRAGRPGVFPNLHTLLMNQDIMVVRSFYPVLRLLPDHAFPALRRVSIMEPGRCAFEQSVHLLQRWSTSITHFFLNAAISPSFWFECLDAFPNLQWGSFTISCSTEFRDAKAFRKLRGTHLQLTTLCVGVGDNRQPNKLISALTLLFGNLHLPALRTLSLSSNMWSSWEDHLVLNDLDNVLRSTPALTTLILEDNFLTLCCDRTAANLSAPREDGDAPPIWHRAPQLTDVQLYVGFYGNRKMSMEAAVDICVCSIIGAEGGWLDLRNPACPFQSLTILALSEYDLRFRDLIVERAGEVAIIPRGVQQFDGSEDIW